MLKYPESSASSRFDSASSAATRLAREVCERWLAAVNARDLDAVLALYAPDSVLLPTFSPHLIRDEARRRDYFTRLAARPGLAVTLHERTFTAQDLGELAVARGIYRFQMEIDVEPYAFELRFTFVVDPRAERPIQHHHSSQIPRTLG
jgi:hypothetical protein